MTHTPGPWEVGEKRGVWAGPVVMADSRSRGVAFVCGESDANACLIAAAPELLECCYRLLQIVEGEYEADPEPEELDTWREAIQLAADCIAKAEGRGE